MFYVSTIRAFVHLTINHERRITCWTQYLQCINSYILFKAGKEEKKGGGRGGEGGISKVTFLCMCICSCAKLISMLLKSPFFCATNNSTSSNDLCVYSLQGKSGSNWQACGVDYSTTSELTKGHFSYINIFTSCTLLLCAFPQTTTINTQSSNLITLAISTGSACGY